MIPAWSNKRRLVPRWRTLEQTLRAGELSSVKGRRSGWERSSELIKRLENWRREPSLISAAELVEAAVVDGAEAEVEAVKAARRLVFYEPSAAPLVREQARQVLMRTGHGDEIPDEPASEPLRPVAVCRQRTRLHPRDALAWVDLALQHTIRSHMVPARRAMTVALSLAPDNRHVLRSAARLFLHAGEPERAHDLLVRSAATRHDPWLLAAEISIAELAERGSRFAKQSKALLEEGRLSNRQVTELSGAMATLELVNGNNKRARKLFARSMMDPTGNALAQAEWATPIARAVIVPEQRLISVREASEAQAFHFYRVHQLQKVPDACEVWAAEEPYSIRPFEFGSAVAGFSGDYERAIDMAARGLLMRPGAPKLVNSHAFALASAGRLDEAEDALRQLDGALDEVARNIASANRGLIAFRRGYLEEGLARYDEAITGFRRQGDRHLETTAKIYLAREALRAGHPAAQALAGDAQKSWKAIEPQRPHPALLEVAMRLADPSLVGGPVGPAKAAAQEATRSAKQAQSWSLSLRLRDSGGS